MEKISFVILTWNSEKTIENCLKSITHVCQSQNLEYEIHIVDNGSADNTVPIILGNADSARIHLIRLPKNLGTTRTRNRALRKCTGDIICIMDSDAALLEGDLRALTDTLRGDSSIGILAPRLIFSGGAIQHSARKFPTLFQKLSRIPYIVFKLPLSPEDIYKDFPFPDITDVDYAISACWFLRRELLDTVGFLDERIFYSPEDLDFCIRTWKKGKRIVYYPHFTVLHHVQQITHKNFFSRIAFSHFFGLVYYFLKHRYIIKPRITRRSESSGNC